MNQNPLIVRLRDFTSSSLPFGNIEGRTVLRKLLDTIEESDSARIIGISLLGIDATDASFPRESVVSLAKQLRGEKGIFLQDLSNRDLIDNWDYAAKAKEQPLAIWSNATYQIIGPEINPSALALIEYVYQCGIAPAAQVAAELNMSVQNASTRLKNLVTQGYLLRSEDVAASGGIEYKYVAIK